jgi:hypothetical protein
VHGKLREPCAVRAWPNPTDVTSATPGQMWWGREVAAELRYTRLQNVRLKNLSFLAKPKIGIFACFFRANLTVLGVLVGSAGE